MLAVWQAGAERSEGRCERSAAKLEGAGVVVTVITVATVIYSGGEDQPGRTGEFAGAGGKWR
jgi:hypothetical protein